MLTVNHHVYIIVIYVVITVNYCNFSVRDSLRGDKGIISDLGILRGDNNSISDCGNFKKVIKVLSVIVVF